MGEYVEADGHKARAKYLLRRAGNSRNEPPEVAPIRHLITAVTNKDREVGLFRNSEDLVVSYGVWR